MHVLSACSSIGLQLYVLLPRAFFGSYLCPFFLCAVSWNSQPQLQALAQHIVKIGPSCMVSHADVIASLMEAWIALCLLRQQRQSVYYGFGVCREHVSSVKLSIVTESSCAAMTLTAELQVVLVCWELMRPLPGSGKKLASCVSGLLKQGPACSPLT